MPVALIALKLPTGALTAVLGLQLVTGVVDRQTQAVLESGGSNPMTKETE